MKQTAIGIVMISLIFLVSIGSVVGQSTSEKVEPQSLEAAWEYAQRFDSQAVLVMQNGEVLFERYANGGGKDRFQPLASGSKSFCGVVAAAAAEDGLLKYDELVCETLEEWKDDPKKAKITIRQLLTLTSGLTPGPSGRSGAERDGWVKASQGAVTTEPGQVFRYGPNAFNVFGLVIESKLGNEKWEEYLARRILKPLQMEVKYYGRCEDGKPQLAGGASMRARDWLAFGEFIRQEGKWEGKQIVDRELLLELFVPTTANPSYGMSWWLNNADERTMMTARADSKEAEGFKMAAGAGKQRLYVIPSKNMVVVRMGRVAGRLQDWNDREFLKKIIVSK